MPGRRYSEEEVARILSRAAELQVRQAGEKGASLDDIERAATEAGIDPALVRQVALDLGRTSAAPAKAGFFGPVRLSFEAVFDGEIDEDMHAAIHDAVQASFALPGRVTVVGRSLHWAHASQNRSVLVSATTRDGRTVVRVEERLGGLMGGIYGGLGGGAGGGGIIPAAAIGGGLAFGPVGAVVGGLVGTAISLFGARAIYLSAAQRREQSVRTAFEAVCASVEEELRARQPAAEDDALARARERQGIAPGPEEDGSGAPDALEQRRVEQQRIEEEAPPGSKRRL